MFTPRPGQRRPDRSRFSSDRLVGLLGVGAFVAGSVVMLARKGLFIQTDTIFLWLIAGLLALSLTDLRRFAPRLIVDWLPLALLFVVYDYSRSLSRWLGSPTHSALQIRFDELLFGKPLLTVRLQHWLGQTKVVRWWEYPMFGVYLTHFFLALAIAAVLWRFAYPRFRQFRLRLVALYTVGFATYVLYPSDPPWLVANRLHALPTIYRTVFEVWGGVGLHAAGSIVEHGNELGNQVAAVPSMHAATSLLICLFFWRAAQPWLRVLMASYVLAMAVTLVYSGEHYVFDVVVGWIYAVAVMAGAGAFERLRAAGPMRIGLSRRSPVAAGAPGVTGAPAGRRRACDRPDPTATRRAPSAIAAGRISHRRRARARARGRARSCPPVSALRRRAAPGSPRACAARLRPRAWSRPAPGSYGAGTCPPRSRTRAPRRRSATRRSAPRSETASARSRSA